jgi:UDP-galactopyranose mutase
VFYFEEPIFTPGECFLKYTETCSGVIVLTPHLPSFGDPQLQVGQQKKLLDDLLVAQAEEQELIFWYYTPMALQFSGHIQPAFCVYDCMDELSAFRFAPTALGSRERELLDRADIVFTGGRSLYHAKKGLHRNIHCFPSSIDKVHFSRARLMSSADEPADQVEIPHPRVGFFGVIDERMDMALVSFLANSAPELQIVMIGPLAKIDATDLPRAANLHWLGHKKYEELPHYLGSWACGIMPFAINESTRFISPTKTPEFLSAGLPLVSTRIADVVEPYGLLGLVSVADNPEEFLAATRYAIATRNDPARLEKCDKYLADKSWDRTFEEISRLIAIGRLKLIQS